MTKLKKIGLLIVLVSVVSLSVGYGAYAIGTRNLRTAVQSIRYRVNVADVLAGTSAHPSLREFTLFTLGPADQVLSWVTQVRTPFTLPSGTRVFVQSIRAVRNGTEVTSCDVAATPDLSYVNFDNRTPNCGTYGFFDENDPVAIKITVSAEDGSDLSALQGGSVDFIVSKIQ